MTFSVNGIKQDKNDKHTVEILVCVDAPLLARKILEQRSILILSLKEFSQDKKTFGDIYFTIKLNFEEIEIVTKYKDIQAACDFFSFVGFDIIYINSYSTPIPQASMIEIISKARAEAEKKKAQVKEQIEKKEAQEKKVYEDANLQSAKKIIVRVFEKVDETTKRSAGQIAIQDMKKIQELTEELRKDRMGTNFEKIRGTIKEILALIERLNAARYLSMQNPEATIASDTLITTIDIDKELDRMENIKILKSLHAKIAVKNQDYAIFGSSAMFWKFLQKDLLYKLADPAGLLYSIYDIAEFILLIIVSLLGIYTIANEVYLFSTSQLGLAFSMISIGIRGLVVVLARIVRKKSVGKLLVMFLLAILLHYLLLWMVTTNFAL